MQTFNDDEYNALNAFFDDHLAAGRPQPQYHDWNASLGYHDAVPATSANGAPQHLPGVAHPLPIVTAGEFLQQQPVAFQNYVGYLANPHHHDLSYASAPATTIVDGLWPSSAGAPNQTLRNEPSAVNPQYGRMGPTGALSPGQTSQLSTEEEEGGTRKRRRGIPPLAKRLLENCFDRHREDPYIPQEEVEQLVTQTGLTLRQVRTFFANARARKLPRGHHSQSPQAGAVDIHTHVNAHRSSPMARFLSSSPEDEGVSVDAVKEAANTMTQPTRASRRRRQHGGPERRSTVSDSAASESSNSSVASVDDVHQRSARRGRKRQRELTSKMIMSIARKPSSPSRKYQCTFCTLDFAQKYDWRRHEESVHFPQKEWVCMPDGPLQASRCVFCNELNPNKRHLESHKSIACSRAPRSQRAFLRKDKLIQHIKQVHTSQTPQLIKEWCRPVERNVKLVCGMCTTFLPDWGSRVDHIAAHFNDGTGMDMWLFERPGGVIPSSHFNHNTKRKFQEELSATPDQEGTITCEVCPERFSRMSNAIVHRRRAHNIYYAEDRQTIAAVGGYSYDTKSSSHLSGGSRSERLSVPQAPSSANYNPRDSGALLQPNPNSSISSQDMMRYSYPGIPGQQPTGPRLAPAPIQVNPPPGGQQMDWQPHPYHHSRHPSPIPPQTAIHANQIDPNLHIDPALRSATPILPSNASPTHMLHRPNPSPQPQNTYPNMSTLAQPDINGVVRTVAHRLRSNAKGSDYPAQGMMHTYEQFGENEQPWPSPYDMQRG